MADKNIMSYETVSLDDEKSALVIIDQTRLPYEVEILHLTGQKEIWEAIYLLKVRGAPAIGVAAGFGIYLAAKQIQADTYEDFYAQFKAAKEYLDSSRPTAVNLSWALNRMEGVVLAGKDKSIHELKELLHKECVAIKEEDVWMCRQIGEYGLSLIEDGCGILTHCNAGQLATSKYGTALAPIHLGRERGMNFKVFTDETRPLFAGRAPVRVRAVRRRRGYHCYLRQYGLSGDEKRLGAGDFRRLRPRGRQRRRVQQNRHQRRGDSGQVLRHSLLRLRPYIHH